MKAASDPAARASPEREEIERFVRAFYVRLLADPDLAPFFDALDLARHIPILCDFWALLLLGEQGYARNAWLVHEPLVLKAEDFERWLAHFRATAQVELAPERAALAVQKAESIALIFQGKLRALGRI